MAVRWQIHFKSLSEVDYYVDIYDSSYLGTATQLTGAANPFSTTENDDEDMYIPIRTQSGYIRFIVEDSTIISQIRPIATTDRPVILRKGANTVWMGFLRPEQYAQPWAPTPYEIEIPVMSVMEAMQGVTFTQDEGYTSLFSLIRTINSYFPANIYITAPQETPVMGVFVQNNNFRQFLTIPERAERSTANKYECVSLYECVEEFCKYFGLSLHEYEDTFFFMVYPDTNITYYDIDTAGNTHESQYGSSTLASLTICGADNRQSYSKVYRRIKGDFDTSTDKAEKIFDVPEFFKMFTAQGAYPSVVPEALLFYGNAEVLPYKNGVQITAWLDSTLNDSGGQIIRKKDQTGWAAGVVGTSFTDCFYVHSQKTKVGSPESAVKFLIPNYVYINNNEFAAFCISFRVGAWFDVTQSGDFIKRVYCKIKVGNYWLASAAPSGSPDVTQYSWTTTETICWMAIESGVVSSKNIVATLDFMTASTLDVVNGIALDMPPLAAGYYPVYFELVANAERNEDFGEYTSVGYLINSLSLTVLRSVNDTDQPTPDYDKNTVIRMMSGLFQDDYMVGCKITTKRGTQYGAGMALDSSHGYISTKYDEIGVGRRASAMNKSRELLTVSVRGRKQPIETITNGGSNYGILSQSVNWRDEKNNIQIINLD